MDRTFPATRAAGLDRLAAFVERAGQAYAEGHSTDHGPGEEASTSALSPYLRRRLLTEREVVEAALAAHGPAGADRFVQEVFWRTYFKGHLETRSTLWADYRRLVAEGEARLAAESGLRRAYERAVEGRTDQAGPVQVGSASLATNADGVCGTGIETGTAAGGL